MNDTLLSNLATTFSTPVYVLDEQELARSVNRIRAALPDRVELCYAMKANPFVLPCLAQHVERIEVCSPGELSIVRHVAIDRRKLVVSGINKDDRTMREAVDGKSACTCTIESESQFEQVLHAARTAGVRIPVLLRLTSGNQFGMDASVVKDLATRFNNGRWVELRGVQYYSGTQKTSVKRLAREIEHLDAFLLELEKDCGFEAPELEYGPGLPVEYFDPSKAGVEAEMLSELGRLISSMRFQRTVVLEIGRSIAASCGTYLTSVVDTKTNGGVNYAIVDGGIHHLAYYGHSMAMRQPPCRLLGKSGGANENAAAWTLCGSLCTANDLLAKNVPFGQLHPGDVVAFEKAGAYCMTEGMSLFLSRDLPSVVVVDAQGNATLVREAASTHPINTPLPAQAYRSGGRHVRSR